MKRNPYTPDAAAALLERVVEYLNATQRRNGARLLRTLLEAPLGDVNIRADVVSAAAAASPTTLVVVFRRLRKVLETLVTTPADGMVLHDALVMPSVQLDANPGKGGHYAFTLSAGYSPTGHIDVTGFAWLQLLRVVHRAGPNRLRTCQCGRLFVRVGKRRFCSERCQTRDYMRRFRSGEAGRGE